MKQVSKASQLNKSVKQVSLASQVKQVGLASQVSNLPKSSQESEIKKVLVKQVQVKQVKSSKFKLSNLNQASEVMLDRDTAPRKRPSTRLSGTMSSHRRRRIIFEISLNNSLIYDSFISQALSDTSAERKNICSKVHRSQGVEAFIEFLCQGWIYRSHRRTKDLGAIKASVHHICNHRITGLHLSGKGGLWSISSPPKKWETKLNSWWIHSSSRCR